ncbi:hypothetical protein [Kineosporia babensis]|uniref:Uncharacterized protein n=1 Tax=Kineosporia babensis TaxID=499548 RepID=A0A9X1SRG4_9ACTN|nr:hypothetical protein [Kineosporia babensis]MCD5309594.1 hypothetical protein [Kineosporia babensis]
MEELLFPWVTDPRDDPAANKRLMTAVHELLRRDGGAIVRSLRPPVLGSNYTDLTLKFGDQELWLLFNSAAKLVAGKSHNRFVDIPHAEVFSWQGFHVGGSELNQPTLPSHLARLSKTEASWARGHRADRLGDLFFNWFD